MESLQILGIMRNFHKQKGRTYPGDASSAGPGCAKELRTLVPRA